jgi:hypothetical protein
MMISVSQNHRIYHAIKQNVIKYYVYISLGNQILIRALCSLTAPPWYLIEWQRVLVLLLYLQLVLEWPRMARK